MTPVQLSILISAIPNDYKIKVSGIDIRDALNEYIARLPVIYNEVEVQEYLSRLRITMSGIIWNASGEQAITLLTAASNVREIPGDIETYFSDIHLGSDRNVATRDVAIVSDDEEDTIVNCLYNINYTNPSVYESFDFNGSLNKNQYQLNPLEEHFLNNFVVNPTVKNHSSIEEQQAFLVPNELSHFDFEQMSLIIGKILNNLSQ